MRLTLVSIAAPVKVLTGKCTAGALPVLETLLTQGNLAGNNVTMCHSSDPLLIRPTSTIALRFIRRESPIEGLCGDAGNSNLNSNRRGLPSSPLAVSPGWDFGKKRGLSVESHRGPVGWLLGQAGGPFEPERGRQMSLIVGLVHFPVAA